MNQTDLDRFLCLSKEVTESSKVENDKLPLKPLEESSSVISHSVSTSSSHRQNTNIAPIGNYVLGIILIYVKFLSSSSGNIVKNADVVALTELELIDQLKAQLFSQYTSDGPDDTHNSSDLCSDDGKRLVLLSV